MIRSQHLNMHIYLLLIVVFYVLMSCSLTGGNCMHLLGSTLKTEVVRSSETSVHFNATASSVTGLLV